MKRGSEVLNSIRMPRRMRGFFTYWSSLVPSTGIWCKQFPNRYLRLAALVLLFGCLEGSARGAIAFDSASSADPGNAPASTVSFSHTVSGTDRILIVGVTLQSTAVVSSVTYGGAGLTSVGFRGHGNIRIEMFRLVAPATGTATVTVNLSAPSKFIAGAVSLTGVSQTSPHGTFQSNAGNGTISTLTVTGGASDELVVDVLGRNDPSNASPSVGQTQRWNRKTNTISGASSTTPGAASVDLSWSVTGGANDWALGAISLRPSLAPSFAKLTSFKATSKKQGRVVLKWQTQYEIDNLGFNIYREENGTYTKLTTQLVAGSALLAGHRTAMTAGNSYSWRDRLSKDPQSVRYWLEDIDISGESTWHGPVSPSTRDDEIVAYPQEDSAMLSSLASDPAPDSKPQFGKPVEHVAMLSKVDAQSVSRQSSLAALPAIKISVSREGWYRVTQPDLVAAGFDPKTNPRYLQLFAYGQEQPISVSGEQDGSFDPPDSVEFYGMGLDSYYSENRVYWLVAGKQPGRRIEAVNYQGTRTAASGFQYTVERKDRSIYVSSLKNGEADNFFGAVVSSSPVTQSLTLHSVDQSFGGEARIEIFLQGVSAVPHEVGVQLNGIQLGEIAFNGQEQGVGKFAVSHTLLLEGENQIILNSLRGAADVSVVASIRIAYWHSYKADNDFLALTAGEGEQVTIDGFTTANIRILDTTNDGSPQEVIGAIAKSSSDYRITFGVPGTGTRRLIAFTDLTTRTAAGFAANLPSNWRDKRQGADLVIIAHRNFWRSIEPLTALRQKQGLKVAVVDIEDLYDEFSFGHKTPQSMKDFLAWSRSNWSLAPRYVLLVGDATFDPRNNLGLGERDFVPTKLVDTSLLETASDDWFADFDSDGLPELAVGRLPVNTAAEADLVVSKIVNYDLNSGFSVSNGGGALLVADMPDSFDFEGSTQRLKALVPAQMPINEVFRSRSDDATVRNQVLDGINQGEKLVNYFGHGSLGVWRGNLLRSGDASNLTNSHQLSLFVMMTCMNTLFHNVTIESLSEALLKAPTGGAVAVWGSSAMTGAREQDLLNQALYKHLFSGKSVTIGEAMALAKAATNDADVRRSWVLLGDPTTRLR